MNVRGQCFIFLLIQVTSKAQHKSQQPLMRQVITRQPIMVGSTKIGEKEVIVQQPITETPPLVSTKSVSLFIGELKLNSLSSTYSEKYTEFSHLTLDMIN